jgi:diguanylate cyclase (GGDEF)-like protein
MSEFNEEKEIWQAIAHLENLFSSDLETERPSHLLKKIFYSEFGLSTFSLFSYDKAQNRLFDLIEQNDMQFSIETPFLQKIEQKINKKRVLFWLSEKEDLAWMYCNVELNTVLILVLEEKPEFKKNEVNKIRGILKVWHLRMLLYASEQKRMRLLDQITQFRTIGEELAKSHQLEEILIKILNTSINLVDAEKGHIMVYDEEAGELRVRTAKGFGSPETDKLINEGKIKLEGLKIGEGIQGRVFESNKAVHISEKNPLLSANMSDILSVICVPLAMNDEVFGVLHITNKKNFAPFEPSDLDIINILATNVAAVLNKHKLFRKSSTDHLTGLFNRSHFNEQVEHELSRVIRYQSSLSLLLIDVDFFKSINDTHGHLVGDDVLKWIATKIKGNLRNDIDIAARFGGEEFVIALPETDSEKALIVSERLRKSIMEGKIIRGGKTIKITVSIGISHSDIHNDSISIKQLLEEADMALYYSKEHGRNQTNIFEKRAISKKN